MELLPTLINALVVALVGVLVAYVTRTQIRDLKQEIADVKRELKQDIGELRQDIRDVRGEFQSEIALLRSEFRSEVASIRSDLTQIALAVGVRPRPQTG